MVIRGLFEIFRFGFYFSFVKIIFGVRLGMCMLNRERLWDFLFFSFVLSRFSVSFLSCRFRVGVCGGFSF